MTLNRTCKSAVLATITSIACWAIAAPEAASASSRQHQELEVAWADPERSRLAFLRLRMQFPACQLQLSQATGRARHPVGDLPAPCHMEIRGIFWKARHAKEHHGRPHDPTPPRLSPVCTRTFWPVAIRIDAEDLCHLHGTLCLLFFHLSVQIENSSGIQGVAPRRCQ